MDREQLNDRLFGLLLGTAVGDAIALPMEGLSRRRVHRLFRTSPLRHAFLLGRGMISDDTEHACMTAQAILASPTDADQFVRSLAWRLRFWLLGAPAGIGFATLRAIVKLWLGFPPSRSGVWSAGNGPAMRAPLISAVLGNDEARMREFVRVSTRLTHSDPSAEVGAACAAWVAHYAMNHDASSLDPCELMAQLQQKFSEDPQVKIWLDAMEQCWREGADVSAYCEKLGISHGVSGYIHHTVPVAIYSWLRHPSGYRRAIEDVVSCGGDTDSVAAITGAFCGALNGANVIPQEWVAGLLEFPRSTQWLRELSEALANIQRNDSHLSRPIPLRWWLIPIRNLLFAVVVILHGIRRLLPPYAGQD
jgi:ADP-ribosylglycohydrolase